jgi:hypothetical protein
MSDRRRALHGLIEQAREEDLPLLRELVARFQHPLDFPLQPAVRASPQTGPARRREELILEAHMLECTCLRKTARLWQGLARRRPCRHPAVLARQLPYPRIMTDQRKALHDQVEQAREEDIDHLIELINGFLHPLESPASQGIVFEPVSPGSKAAAEIEQQRQRVLARLRAERSEMIYARHRRYSDTSRNRSE